MKIVFKTFLNQKYGTGHFFRCLNLAGILNKKYKYKIVFFTNRLKSKFKKILKEKKIINYVFDKKHPDKEFINKIKNISDIKFIILDNLKSNLKIEKKIKSLKYNLCIIEDNYKKHFSDILINPNFVNKKKLKQNNMYTKNYFIGPKYALNINRLKTFPKIKKSKKILVYMGGSDSKDLTYRILKSLNKIDFKNYKITVIRGIINKNFNHIYNLKKNMKNLEIIDHQKDFTKKLANFNYCVTSGGSSLWQMLYMNLKVLVINQNSRQTYNSEILQKKNYIKLFSQNQTEKKLYQFFKKHIINEKKNFKKFDFSKNGILEITKAINES